MPYLNTHGLARFFSKLPAVARSGSYNDLTDKPSVPAAGLPSGGTTGQVLAKSSNTDYAAGWVTPSDTTMTWYGTSSTTASTTAKVVDCTNYTLKTGAIIGILFSTANTASAPTLNINSTGAIALRIGNTAPSSTANVLKWSANTMIYVMYDGTYYRLLNAVSRAADNSFEGGGTWYGTCSTAAGTAAKTSTITNFRLTVGALVSINFSTPNTVTSEAVTLNVNSTGAKTIAVAQGATSSSVHLTWVAKSVLTFMYDGTYWRYLGTSQPPTAVLPSGGTSGQVLAKSSGDDYAVGWVTPSAGGGGGAWYGFCQTAAATGTKEVSAEGTVLTEAGTIIYVDMQYGNTANDVYLDVDGGGATRVWLNGDQTSSTNKLQWNAGDTLAFIFMNDGTWPPMLYGWTYLGGSTAAGMDASLPAGGTAGQVLSKSSGTDYDAGWETLSIPSVASTTSLLKGNGSGGAVAASSSDYVAPSDLAEVATSGDYGDLDNLPTIPSIASTSTLLAGDGSGNAIAADPSSLFALEQYVIIDGASVANNGVAEDTVTVSKAGYYPLAIAGWTSANRYPNVYGCRLTAQSVGSASIFCGASNFSGSTRTLTVSAVVLWMKVT